MARSKPLVRLRVVSRRVAIRNGRFFGSATSGLRWYFGAGDLSEAFLRRTPVSSTGGRDKIQFNCQSPNRGLGLADFVPAFTLHRP